MTNLDLICGEICNFFESEIRHGIYHAESGFISPLDFVSEGQYFRIVGSKFNDGVWKNTSADLNSLVTEDFDGEVWAMSVPPSFIALTEEIAAFNSVAAISPYTSESFGGYSYSKAAGKSGGGITWQEAFASKLKRWRKLC